jgi:small-conductance mechanosensitive channel
MIGDPQVPDIDRVTGNEVDYLILVKTTPAAQDAVTRELRRRIKECFESNQIRPGGQTRYYVADGPAPPRPQPELYSLDGPKIFELRHRR